MKITARHLFIGLALLADIQVCWWAYIIVGAHPDFKFMIIAEGLFFVLILSCGIAYAYNSIQKELRLKQNQADFLGAITHEFKTPLANVRLCLDTLERPNLDKESLNKYVRRAQEAIDHLLDEVETILSLTQQSVESAEVQKASLKSILTGILETFDPNTRRKISFKLDDFEFMAPYHESRLILRNLIDNALKYSQSAEDGGSISIEANPTDAAFQIKIKDNGIGCETQDLMRAFEPFYRGENSKKLFPSGTGLGLSLVKRLATQSGIKIKLESEGTNMGCVATVSWPLQAGDS